ncbi:hypothetical protein [Uliginosibacterium gangwonense]|uniref:spermine/spermidine synthase domain-containing protein n=1 Tax=Uliginosibacterium gangwonense TaxID=392736 RepID=UPI0003649055|nr:hypothetical protein [Uliginosibacterium gangwonense]
MDAQALKEQFAEHLGWLAADARLLASGQSAYQRWEVWQTPAWGRLYRLDDCCMATEADEFMCHEPLVHVAALAQAEPRRALVLGGGDGASARELLRYPSMQEVLVAELDAEVVKLVQRYLPSLPAGAWDDPRVKIVYGDARDYVCRWQNSQPGFDLVIFDLTDPGGLAAPLFTAEFLMACKRVLNPGGALCLQWGAPFFQPAQCAALYQVARTVFRHVRPIFPWVPSYGGLWAMAVLADAYDPATLPDAILQARLAQIGSLRALDAAQYHALQACPPWLAKALGENAK